MHPLTKRLIECPEILDSIVDAIAWRELQERLGTSAASRESIAAEKAAVEEFKKLIN